MHYHGDKFNDTDSFEAMSLSIRALSDHTESMAGSFAYMFSAL